MASPPGGYGPPGGGYPPPPPGYGPQGYQPQPGPAQKPITGSAQTMALHAMTIDPKTGLPRGEKPPASTSAVLALVCGILLCLGPLTGPVAVVAGLIGRAQVKAKPHSVGGRGMATAGLVLGILSSVGWVCGLIYYLSQSD